MVGLVLDGKMKEYLAAARANDCEVNHDREAGTVDVRDGETVVLKAIQKGRGGPWITRFSNSDRISWGPMEAPC